MMHGGVTEDPHQPGEQQCCAQAEQLDADFVAVTFGETNQRQAPHAKAQFDEQQPDQQMRQGIEEVSQSVRIQRMTFLSMVRPLRMTAHQAIDDHAQHQQYRADQGLTQGGTGIASREERGEQ